MLALNGTFFRCDDVAYHNYKNTQMCVFIVVRKRHDQNQNCQNQNRVYWPSTFSHTRNLTPGLVALNV